MEEDELFDIDEIADLIGDQPTDEKTSTGDDNISNTIEDTVDTDQNDDKIDNDNPGEDDIEDLDDGERTIDDSPDEEEEESDSKFDSITEVLKTYGVSYDIPDEYKERLDSIDNDEDKVQEYIKIQSELRDREIDDRFEKLVNGVSPDVKPLFDIFVNGGSAEDIIKLARDRAEVAVVFKEDLINDKDLQIKEVKSYFKGKDLDDDVIEALVEKLDTEDRLESESLKALKYKEEKIAKSEESKQEQLKQEQQRNKEKYDRWKGDISSHIDSIDEILPNNPLSKKDKEQLKSTIFDKTETIDGPKTKFQIAMADDPTGMNVKINYLLSIGAFEDKKVWDKIIRKGVTKQNKSIIDTLSSTNKKGKSSKTKPSDSVIGVLNKFL